MLWVVESGKLAHADREIILSDGLFSALAQDRAGRLAERGAKRRGGEALCRFEW
jgi:hypothetical protein